MGFNNDYDGYGRRSHHGRHRDRFDEYGPRSPYGARGSFRPRDSHGSCGRDECRDHRRRRSGGFFFVFPRIF